jgi:ribosome-associated protein
MIQVTDDISIDELELKESFIRSSGPGGQNVNKVSTAVQLRFDVRGSPSLSPSVKERLARLAGSRMTLRGEIVIHAQRFRTLERNRQDAVDRLVGLIRRAAIERKLRRPTKPTRASIKRRLEVKNQRSATKVLRRLKRDDD